MQVKLKINNDDDTLSYVNVKLTPLEWLLVKRAMIFYIFMGENETDRKLMKKMLEVKATKKYLKAAQPKEEGDEDAGRN